MRAWVLSASLLLLASCASSAPDVANSRVVASRADGEGHAGRGELVLRLKVFPQNTSGLFQWVAGHGEQATVEILYQGLDDAGRALFERRDLDRAAAPAGGQAAESKREIALDLRTSRLLHVQDKVIEIREAGPTGVVFRLY